VTRVITTTDELREIVKEPPKLVMEKEIDHIDAQSRRFLELSPFFLLATSAGDGSCDVSPRGDPPGSVLVLDEHTLVFADRKGNRRADSLRNLLQRPHVGLLFLVPGVGHTIRVNGSARIVADAPYFSRMAFKDTVPQLAVEVRVEELFTHCSKAFARSGLWDTETWSDADTVPSPGQLGKSQLGIKVPVPAKLLDAAMARDAKSVRYEAATSETKPRRRPWFRAAR
jgi:PPOX class probable FMN-dependent enzyme